MFCRVPSCWWHWTWPRAYCNNRKLLKGFNDLESRFPDIASEWAYDLNGISPSEAIYNKGKFWFRCNTCGNTWKAYLSNRTHLGVGCPACGHVKQRNIRASKNNDDHYGKSLSVAYPELALEWNKTKNGIEATEVFGFSTLKAKCWLKYNKCDYEWQSTIKNRTRGRACPMCSLANRHKMVRNIDTKEVFSSVNDAAEKYHCSASSITNCCKGRNSTCMGYHWEYYSYNEWHFYNLNNMKHPGFVLDASVIFWWQYFIFIYTTKRVCITIVEEDSENKRQRDCPQTMLSTGKLSMPFEAVVSGHYVYL